MTLTLAQISPPPSSTDELGDNLSGQWSRFLDWLTLNWPLVLLVLVTALALILLILWLGQRLPTKGLKRDGLEVMRRDLLKSNTALDVRGKSLWLTGNELLPAQRLGRLRGYCRDVEAMWYAYRPPGLFVKVQLFMCNPDDVVSSHESREIHVRAVSVRYTRGAYCAVPDVHDPRERHIWSRAAGRDLATPGDLAEFWKEYVSTAIDNLVGMDEALLAAQDRHYLRQRVTYADDERPTETVVPQPPPPTVGSHQSGAENHA